MTKKKLLLEMLKYYASGTNTGDKKTATEFCFNINDFHELIENIEDEYKNFEYKISPELAIKIKVTKGE